MKGILKVIIVDDEYLIRNLIKMKVNWEDVNMEVVGEAGNAEQALELIDKLNPDIIFTDICMPSMDGIELSKNIIEKYPDIKIIIVTGYDDFEYARSGIKLGIYDFILKPINSSELMETLSKLRNIINSKRNHEEEYNQLKKQVHESLPILKEKFLNELLFDQLTSEEIMSKFEYFKINVDLYYNVFQIALIEVDNLIKDERKEENKILLSMQCFNIIQNFFKEDNYVFVFFDNGRRIAILSNSEKVDLIESCELLKKIIIDRLECSVSLGVGMKKGEAQNIRFSYKEAIEAVNYKVIAGKNQVISYTDIHVGENIFHNRDEDKIGKLSLFINAGAKENALEILEQIFTISAIGYLETMKKARLQALDVLFACQRIASEQKITPTDIWKSHEKINELILKADNLPELKQCMRECVEDITGLMQKSNAVKANTFIKNVKEYLNNNISNQDLSLSSVAKEFFISSGHLGRLFKQQTSKTFIEYLTEIRIKKVQKLLLETNLNGSQISERVGISDSHYLSILFKKHTGLCINEFRKFKKV
ncbi:two component transcriptional regulator, AraC family [Clostridium sp. DL-VIII]|uniref:response regulator n=1 Tax=Clostridium sp. DL-VIII TaxID=641107 RepID=UPI00023AFF1A|nr:response regulator [Clostridium sp. DL-VIII]EHI99706.1 two component transcriptional regulator, AraC family [Clostridium sp. DL-VIII]